MRMWKIVTFVILVLMLLLLGSVYDVSVEIAGVDVPGWIVVFVSYVLGVLALYAQYRSEGRIAPKGSDRR